MQKLMYGANRVRCQKLVFLFANDWIHRLCLQKLLIILFNHTGGDFIQLHMSDDRRNIVINQTDI